MAIDINQSVQSIKAALRAHPRNQLNGAQVHAVIQAAAPEINVREIVGMPTGPGALKRFISAYLQDALTTAGNWGGDVLYGIVGRTSAVQNESVAAVWRTFVSPNSPMTLVLKRDDLRLVARLGPAANEGENEIEISRATPAEHEEILSSFENALSHEEAQAIRQLHEAHESFHKWIAALRSEMPIVYRKWGVYRKDRLLELLIARVAALGLSAEDERVLITQINASQSAAYQMIREGRQPIPVVSSSGRGLDLTDRSGHAGTEKEADRARQLAHRAVELMGYDDLRALRIPLGAIIDAM